MIAMLAVPGAAFLPDQNPLPKGQAFDVIWGLLKDLQKAVQDGDSALRALLNTETIDRKAADKSLQDAMNSGGSALKTQLDTETTDRKAADTSLQNAITSGDKALQAQLDSIQLIPVHFGAWDTTSYVQDSNGDVIGIAPTDGFVVATAYNNGDTDCNLHAQPSLEFGRNEFVTEVSHAGGTGTITMPVRKGDRWHVNTNCDLIIIVSWIPLTT